MATGKIELRVEADEFIKATRLNFCKNRECKFFNGGNCEFKQIELDEKGKCRFVEKKLQAR